jgi:methylenetetrahydrofolate--tRNA-(uracil-5-)-methyltransferase
MNNKAKVIGAGLAGVEAAWQLANSAIEVELYEMKPVKYSPAHKYKGFAELVCSNSLKADRIESAAGMLKEEMRRLGSLTMQAAQASRVSAGGALAVDRTMFSDIITEKIKSHRNIRVIETEVTDIPDGNVIIATGPLTSEALADKISELCGEYLYFHDAAAPIVSFDSLDKQKVFFASRYDKGEADYINCPMDKNEYLHFYNELINAQSAELKQFEKESQQLFIFCRIWYNRQAGRSRFRTTDRKDRI